MSIALASQPNTLTGLQPVRAELDSNAHLVSILSSQVSALEVALKEADLRIRQAEADKEALLQKQRLLQFEGDVQGGASSTLTQDRAMLLSYSATILLNHSAGETMPVAILEACNRLEEDDTVLRHFTHVRRFYESADVP